MTAPLIKRRNLGRPMYITEGDANLDVLDIRTGQGWKDLTTPLISATPTGLSNQTPQPFGPDGDISQYVFSIGDQIDLPPFHVNHDIVPNSDAYIHVHWSTDGTSTNSVKWMIHVVRAKGHQQQPFGAKTTYYVEQAAVGTPWMHMVAECTTPITLTEPDELIFVSLHRITNGVVDNPNTIFGLMCDIHYQADRDATPNRFPNFYV